MMAIQAVRTNVARQIAVMSGGEYAPFTTERGFEARVQEVAKHARNRYLLSFRPTDSTPGLHVLEVRLTRDLGATGGGQEPATGRWKSRRSGFRHSLNRFLESAPRIFPACRWQSNVMIERSGACTLQKCRWMANHALFKHRTTKNQSGGEV